MRTIYTIIITAAVLLAGACSGDKSNTSENVFKEQTDAIKKAEQVEVQVMKQAELQQKSIEQQTRQ